jgi:hypothetical protein
MVDAISSYNLVAAHMDRMTKVTLWVAALVLGSYFVWAFLDCALDPTCQLRCASTGGVDTAYHSRGACVYQRAAPKPINAGRPTHDIQD